jgi:hypothetical protein
MAPDLMPLFVSVTVIGLRGPSTPFMKFVSGTVAVGPVPVSQETTIEKK